MKAKLKSANGFVRFLLNHGEKIGIVAVVAVAGLLFWKSLGREKLGEDKQPPALQSKARDADDHVRNMTWEKIDPENQTNSKEFFARSGETAITPVPLGVFPPMAAIDPPVTDPVKLRTDPVLLTVVEPEVSPGSGMWLSADPAVIERKMREALKQREKEQAELAKEQERLAQEGEQGGRRGDAAKAPATRAEAATGTTPWEAWAA
jgi:hypothetical protein